MDSYYSNISCKLKYSGDKLFIDLNNIIEIKMKMSTSFL